MLSTLFKSTITNLYNSIDRAKVYDEKRNDKNDKWGYQSSFKSIIMCFKKIDRNIISESDASQYNNYIIHGILRDTNRLEEHIKNMFMDNTKRIDYMEQCNQDIIKSLILCCNKKYTIEKSFYNTIKSDSLTIYYILLLEIHTRVMLQNIYFIWKSNIELYMPDFIICSKLLLDYNIKLTPYMDYESLVSNIMYIYNSNKDKYTDIFTINTFFEKLVTKYKNINLFTIFNTQNNKNISSKKYTQTQLLKVKVGGLKDLCRKEGIKLTSKMRRIDLENALLSL